MMGGEGARMEKIDRKRLIWILIAIAMFFANLILFTWVLLRGH
jgi:hypothetical protein